MSEQPTAPAEGAQPSAFSRFAHRVEEDVEGVVKPAAHDAETAVAQAKVVVGKVDAALQADLTGHTGRVFDVAGDIMTIAKELNLPQLDALVPKVLSLAGEAAQITSGVLSAV
jgi:hypothetical protein